MDPAQAQVGGIACAETAGSGTTTPMTRNAVVTGAGSGVGQSIAVKLAQLGWGVAILGRREKTLQETISLAGDAGSRIVAYPCDIGDEPALNRVAKQILERFQTVDALINAAGTNAPRRALEVLALQDYHEMINTNLHGAYYCAQAFLPHMRSRRTGTIINVVSDAGKQASPKAGPAYVMSKFGMAGLNQAINAEERANGIRACAIFPGDIDTPLLDKRPSPPPADARARMMKAEDIADCALFCLQLPDRAIVEEMIVRPR
jgi:NAD(P)-dependent dehydrogenase (short-subunit alcohol dehydrogenase family)